LIVSIPLITLVVEPFEERLKHVSKTNHVLMHN